MNNVGEGKAMTDDEGASLASAEHWKADRTTFQRIYDVLTGTTAPATVGQFAKWADCSENGARKALDQLVEMGIGERTGTRPATYRRNRSYFRWKRVEALARDHRPRELRDRLGELIDSDRNLQEKYGVPDPDAVTAAGDVVVDHEALHERWDDLTEWRTIRRDIVILRRAVNRAESRRDERARV